MTATRSEFRYRTLASGAPADELEQEVLERWKREDLFARTLRAGEGKPSFVFFEGPPTANGRPGIHHVLSRTIKDLFCRHRAMKGFYVARRAGWDTHGLPVEIEVEKQLGISGKQQIEEIGVEKFNALCRESVWRYKADWEKMSERIGFWLDYDHAYITYTNEYIESVWWALTTLYQRDLLYRGQKILPYCPRCGTALSSHEVAQGWKDVKDPSVYIALDLVSSDDSATTEKRRRRRILVWTTTPWTLVSNVALAVNPELDYLELTRRSGDGSETIILAESRAAAVLGDGYTDRWETAARLTGAQLEGTRYTRPLDWIELGEGRHELIVAESFVSSDGGTGVVHMAPAFGADDYASGQRNGLSFVQPVDQRGEFPADMPVVGGMFVKAADPKIIAALERRGVLWKAGQIEHPYPHCWRCETPLLYFARGSWFIRTTAFRDAMLTRSARMDWHPPESGTGRFGEWLENNIDWAISRDRYWGTPLPLWLCDADESHVEAIGSFEQLEKRLGEPLGATFDAHKPYIDRHEWKCEVCSGTMRRVPQVIDTWFDSGSMPFAQWHFPFKNRKELETNYPADFIAEGVDQTRGWFYSLLAIATGLGDALPRNTLAHQAEVQDAVDTAPFRSVVVNDVVLDAEGIKMSKSRGNVVDPNVVLPRYGADAVRLFLVASSQVWMPRRFDESGIRDTAGRFLLTFKNVYSGIFAQYANFGWEPSALDPIAAERPDIDRWILSRLAGVERQADAMLERYDATLAARAVMDFFVDDVSNWYVRLNRHRFYDVDGDDNRAAFATLHEVLVVSCRLLAPFAPFLTDWIHTELTGDSVHLAAYTRAVAHERDADLEKAMDHLRTLVTLGRAAREDAGVNVRQPLQRMVCVVPGGGSLDPKVGARGMEKLVGLLADELNVKEVTFLSSADALVTLEAKPNFRALGKKFGKQTPLAASAVSALGSEALLAFEKGEALAISVGNEARQLDVDDLVIVRRASGSLVVKEGGGYFAAVDPAITPELRAEGLAREIVSRVQRMRKEAGFAVSDRIVLWVGGTAEIEAAVKLHTRWIADEVLARQITIGGNIESHNAVQSVDIDGQAVSIALERAV
ncbi:MAG TPA: isoleucine--tRNA ligase [Gemmatimonadaceae bacterium]|nr:isoleucine--tRNA ligase [Gemmatimonadaceae bacterium]